MSMRNIYRKIARENGVSVEEVKRDMQAAIDYAYKSPKKDLLQAIAQGGVPSRGEIPTPDEFVAHATSAVKKRMR